MLVFQEFHQIFIDSSKFYIYQLNFSKISGNVRIFWSSCERNRTSQHFLRNRKGVHFNCGAGFTRQNLSCEVLSGNINLQRKIVSFRNQDFGFLFIWNITTHNWMQTTALKDIVIHVNYEKNGQILYKGVTFAGHLGTLTGKF